jgi:F0F1-type ATP synthase membrane subunit b/b'
LKWILAALAAGFIGQFGRSLALRLTDRKRRQHEAESLLVQVGQQAKSAKKLANAEVKRAKKRRRAD